MRPEPSDQQVLSPGSVAVEVPATSANLGPGFDCGLALDWRERVSLAVIEQGYQIDVSGKGQPSCLAMRAT